MMKKIFTLLCTLLLLAVPFASAQKTLFVLSKSGELAAYPAQKVSFDNDLFAFTYGDVTELTKESFSASFTVAFTSDEYYKLAQSAEIGICFSDESETPTISDGRVKTGYSLGKQSFSVNGLDAGTTYYYRAYMKLLDAVFYGDVQSVTTFGKKTEKEYILINGHKFVDLGLPSGLLWATCNIGATSAYGYGEFFAWGETEPKTDYFWDTYKYGNSSNDFTKYNFRDRRKFLEKEDDAAYVNWGSSCRMPTKAEFEELLSSDNCTWTWTNGGYKVESKSNGNSIFLPASGYRYGSSLGYQGSYGSYWSSTLDSSYRNSAYDLDFYSSDHIVNYNIRYSGCPVRPVAEP